VSWIVLTAALVACTKQEPPGIQNIRDRGYVRFAHLRFEGHDTLPRVGLGPDSFRRTAEAFAAAIGVEPRWHQVDREDALIPALLAGDADVIVGNLMMTDARAAHVAFTLPVTQVREWVIGRKGEVRASRVADLAGRSFGAVVNTPAREATKHLAGIDSPLIIDLPAGTRPEAVVAQLAAGAFDLAILDQPTARVLLEARSDVERVLTLPGRRNIAWAVRHDSPDLLTAINEFITARHLVSANEPSNTPRDLADITASGRLRMLTVGGPVTYYLWRGELMGFDYELMRRYADAHRLELEVVLARSSEQLIPWLLEGRGDVIAASVTISAEREQQGIRFTRPYLEVDEVLVSNVQSAPVRSPADLAGRVVSVNPVSVHVGTAQALIDEQGIALRLDPLDLQTEEFIAAVAAGELDVTIADSHIAALEAAFRPEIRIGPVLRTGAGLGWAVRADHDALRVSLDDFIRREYKRRAYGALLSKYFKNERRMRSLREYRIAGAQLSPYDDLIKPVAARYRFDWRLIVAQIYEESQFEPTVRSRAGARGLMQIVPRTAIELGIDPSTLSDPSVGIEAGVRYLDWTRSLFPDSLSLADRLWFALAAYNAGPGHVRDARILARRQGWDPDRWFGSVERAMLLLGKREYAAKARHGYVRGSEPVRYVADIRRRFRAYVDHLSGLPR